MKGLLLHASLTLIFNLFATSSEVLGVSQTSDEWTLASDDDCGPNLQASRNCSLTALQLRARTRTVEQASRDLGKKAADSRFKRSEPDASDESEKHLFQTLIKEPLLTMSMTVKESVNGLLPKVSRALGNREKHDWDYESLQNISVQIRSIVSDALPILINVLLNSSAMDKDQAGNLSAREKRIQDHIVYMQNFSARAAPIVLHQARSAYGDDGEAVTIVPGINKGIGHALEFLGSYLDLAWDGLQKQLPYVQGVVDNSTVTSESLTTIGCAADFSDSISGLTRVVAKLTYAVVDCNRTSAVFDPKQCAADTAGALRFVAKTCTKASDLLGQCYGHYWGCAQLLNSAQDNFLSALSSSLIMSSNCNLQGHNICRAHAYVAVSDLYAAVGRLGASAGSCRVRATGWNETLPV